MSFYVKSTPEVAKFLKTKHDANKVFVVNSDLVFCDLIENTKHYTIPEYKFHPKHGLVPTYYSDLFLDNALEDWGSSESLETKQQNEKQDQKEENENMNRKEDFQVGQRVLIKNDQNYHLSDFGDKFIGLEVTVMSKFTIHSKTEGGINMVAVMANEIDGFGKNICCCFREDMCHPVKTERQKQIEKIYDLLIDWENLENIAEQLYNTGYLPVKTTNKD